MSSESGSKKSRKSAKAEAFENPLIPNARLRQMYVAMLQARLLDAALSAKKRAGTKGLEACLVSPAVDLCAGDLISDVLGSNTTGGVVSYLRGAGLRAVFGFAGKSRRPTAVAECGMASSLVVSDDAAVRLWVAVGAAAGLKARALANVVVVYLKPAEAVASATRKVMEFVAKHELPMFFIVLPGGTPGRAAVVAHRAGVPGIAVDSDDAVAIYRVTQESVGRARVGGGAALMECLPYTVGGAKPSDPVKMMEGSLIARRVATKPWMERETRTFVAKIKAERGA